MHLNTLSVEIGTILEMKIIKSRILNNHKLIEILSNSKPAKLKYESKKEQNILIMNWCILYIMSYDYIFISLFEKSINTLCILYIKQLVKK